MKGYYHDSGIGESGTLKIEATNIPEFRKLIEQAKEEAVQLQKTINRLENFDLEVKFSSAQGGKRD
ncbi:hypothetical protein KO465_09305 [Candidatus Micrarchaeota archaeon]|jgi:hypothetical protein|nr:hypothetical protein [Candidatus Micrarchaeota archaeon]